MYASLLQPHHVKGTYSWKDIKIADESQAFSGSEWLDGFQDGSLACRADLRKSFEVNKL